MKKTSNDPFHEETSSNPVPEDNEMLGMLHDLQAPIEHEEETEEGLENDIPFNSGVKEETTNIFQEILNQARSELYPDCSKFSSLNFFGYVDACQGSQRLE
ncbi:GDSL esterase/lipase [Cucumis melo var. makuwa]|uniref:GDSL esterase/lipase n=1 Tax=Cucumis melo var. makuwa TaxID=1194695 RepID=A0A5D3C554_CUCMM|nr:GDSL esterase/lipase [Cucumis melo var. makuwa]TYK06505.1 GDSL esterase/lipase [Cucumis melo var. makuwa]